MEWDLGTIRMVLWPAHKNTTTRVSYQGRKAKQESKFLLIEGWDCIQCSLRADESWLRECGVDLEAAVMCTGSPAGWKEVQGDLTMVPSFESLVVLHVRKTWLHHVPYSNQCYYKSLLLPSAREGDKEVEEKKRKQTYFLCCQAHRRCSMKGICLGYNLLLLLLP